MGDLPNSEVSRRWLELDKAHGEHMHGTVNNDQNKLLELASSYLAAVSHDKRFTLFWLGDFLYDKMKREGNFSLETTAEAFGAVERQASFMIRFPHSADSAIIAWDSDVCQKIREASLWPGGQQLLFEMGFEATSESLRLNEARLDESTLLKVGRDCLLARAECIVMANILAGLSASGFQVSLTDLADFRKGHVGSVEQAIVELIDEQKRHGTLQHLDPVNECRRKCEREMEELTISQNEKLQKLLDENEEKLQLVRKENEAKVSNLLRENEARVKLMQDKHREEERAAEKGRELDNQRLSLSTPAMPECPVCLEEMIPPQHIFHCQNGHLICEACRKSNHRL